jgi:hypothetical protein
LHEVGDVLGALSRGLQASVVIDEHGAHASDVAEAFDCFVTRIFRRHTESDVTFDAHLEVEGELVVNVGGDVGPHEPEISPPPWRALRDHAIAGSARSTRVTACE